MLSQSNLRGAIHVCGVKRIPLALAFAILMFTLPAFAAETRGVKRVEIKTSSGETVGLYEESHALVIGVSDYTNGWPKLPGVRKDVKGGHCRP